MIDDLNFYANSAFMFILVLVPHAKVTYFLEICSKKKNHSIIIHCQNGAGGFWRSETKLPGILSQRLFSTRLLLSSLFLAVRVFERSRCSSLRDAALLFLLLEGVFL